MLKQLVLAITLLTGLGSLTGSVQAQVTLDQRLSDLSTQISNGLTENQKKTIAVVEFGDLEGRVTNFGRFLAEELITRLYQTKKFKVIERQLLNRIVAEQKLSLSGMIDQTSAQKLGQLLGVDAIASGTVTDLGKSLRINARLISTGTGEVFAVAATEIVKDDSVLALMGAGPTEPNGTDQPSVRVNKPDPTAIATKDVGPLRVALKSIIRVNLFDRWGTSVNGVRCQFEFINLDSQKPLVVSMNANAGTSISIGDYLRSTLVDEDGNLWTLHNSEVAGMSIIGVGTQGWNSPMYDPAQIGNLLSRRDNSNSDFARDGDLQYRFIFGSVTEMSPGERLTVTATFRQTANRTSNSSTPAKVFQIASEVVVGVGGTGTKKSYSLHNLTFDGVNVRSFPPRIPMRGD